MRIVKFALLLAVLAAVPVFAQIPPPPPMRNPGELDQMVARIALYPDPLVAQILAAATSPTIFLMLPSGRMNIIT